MEVKNLFEPAAKQEIINRIHQLFPDTKQLWGKMNVAQMLAHVQKPIEIALGTHQPKGSFLLRLIGPLFKSKLWDEKPYKKNLPADPAFIMTGTEKNIEKEKQELMNMITRFTEANMISEKHPIFGKLSKENRSKATWKHPDHHLKQFGV